MRRITLVHLDLGIGGAEQLVVGIACTLKHMGHSVTIMTSHHDQSHCFDETKSGGALNGCIQVYGDWLPRHIFGKFTAFCAIVRMLYLSYIVLSLHLQRRLRGRFFKSANNLASSDNNDELIFMDGVSVPLPLFFFAGIPSIFYCHFPDKLLCTDRESLLKRFYRAVIDFAEEITTGCSSLIVVNSNFTGRVFKESFPSLTKYRHLRPLVLYPTVEDQKGNQRTIQIDSEVDSIVDYTGNFDIIFVSLNRFERKKNIALAIDAFDYLRKQSNSHIPSKSERSASERINAVCSNKKRVLLVIAGGYDPAVIENVEYLLELQAYTRLLGLQYSYNQDNIQIGDNRENGGNSNFHIVFRTSISGLERESLLHRADALLYTPDREHFGIVPLEAMYAGTPVICVASGGPLETVLHGYTGYLCKQNASDFAEAMGRFTSTDSMTEEERNNLERFLKGYEQELERNQSKDLEPSLGPLGASSSSPPSLSILMGRIGRAHVQSNFTSSGTPDKLSECIERAIKNHQRPLSPYISAVKKVVPILFLNLIIFIAIAVAFFMHSFDDR